MIRVLTRPSALVFDLDGTLVESRADIADACNFALAAHGRPRLDPARIAAMVGDGARSLVTRALSAAGHTEDVDVDAVLETFHARYLARPVASTTLLPGAREALATSIPKALVTNKPRAITLRVLAELGLTAAFAAIWAGGDGPLKPDPAGVLSVLGAMRVPPPEAWMIGDGPQDVIAGRSAGLVTIGVFGIAAREELAASSPDVLVDALGDVVHLLVTARA